jgi:hypothetical protein
VDVNEEEEVGPSTGKLVKVPSVKVPKVVDAVVLGDGRLVHQITPSLLSLQVVVVTNFVLVTTVVATGILSVMTTTLVTTTVLRLVVEFHNPEDAGAVVLAGLVESGMPVDDGTPVPGKDRVTDDKSPLKVLLGTGGEYGGGGA